MMELLIFVAGVVSGVVAYKILQAKGYFKGIKGLE